MSCRQIQKMLTAYQDGELGATERSRIASHLQNCMPCSKYYEELERVWQSLEEIREIQTSSGFYHRLYEKINTSPEHFFRRCFQWFIQLFPVRVATLALLLMGLLFGSFLGNTIVKDGPWSFKTQANYSQARTEVDFFKVFAPVPPGSLGDGYLRMVSFTEDHEK